LTEENHKSLKIAGVLTSKPMFPRNVGIYLKDKAQKNIIINLTARENTGSHKDEHVYDILFKPVLK
jgi:hypothetical protein